MRKEEAEQISQRYKIIISILAGLIGVAGLFLSIRLDFGGARLNFVWSIGLPLLVSLSWGPWYGLLSAVGGGTFLYPFILGFSNGWASIVPSLSFILWILLHGKGAQWRNRGKRLQNNLYVLQVMYAVIRWVLYSTLFPLLLQWNPPFWNPEAVTEISRGIIILFAVRGIIMESVLLAVCDAILLLPPVRRFFRMESRPSSRYSVRIMGGMVAFGILFILFILFLQNAIIDGKILSQWLFPPDEKTRLTFFLSLILFIIMGGIAVRYFQQALENQLSLKESEKKYMTIFESIHDLYFETTREGEILIASPSVKTILGYEAEELLAMNIQELYMDLSVRQELLFLLEKEKEINNFEVVMFGKDGEEHYLWLHARLDGENETEKIISVGRDVTNYQHAMMEVKKLNRELSQRVEERTMELRKAVSELEGFTYTISHDLKSPLKAIDAYTMMMQEELGEALSGEPLDMMQQISKTSSEMVELIDQLLQYALVAKTELVLEKLSVAEEVRSIFEEQVAGNSHRNIGLKMEKTLPHLWADRILFRQVLRNVLSNAVKFTSTREQAIIEIFSEVTDSHCTLVIRDNGVGFDMNHAGKLFEVLQRMHAKEEFEGTGIGLATVKKIMQKHGGEVFMEGQVNGGAVVKLIFPRKESKET